MVCASTAFTKMLVGSIVLVMPCGAATAADTGVGGGRSYGPSINDPAIDLPPASDVTRCNTVLANPQAFEVDLYELCKLLRSLTKPQRLQPKVELT